MTTLLSYGIPHTVAVQPPKKQVKGTCYNHRASLIPPGFLQGLSCGSAVKSPDLKPNSNGPDAPGANDPNPNTPRGDVTGDSNVASN